MTDYLELILAALEEREDPNGQSWPEAKKLWPFSVGMNEEKTAAPPSWKNSALSGDAARAVGDWTPGAADFQRVYIDGSIHQVDHLEQIRQNSQENLWNILPDLAWNQESAPEKEFEGETVFDLLERGALGSPAQSGRAAEGRFPLLAQIQNSRQAVENSRRRDALRPQSQVQPLEAGWERMPRREVSQTQAQDTAQLVDRAFRRDARRYDGGFTLF